MKITKYLMIVLAVIVVAKKTLHAADLAVDASKQYPVSGGWVTSPGARNYYKRHIFGANPVEQLPSPIELMSPQLFTVDNNLAASTPLQGAYNPQDGTATISFTDVITTSQSITPPSVNNPDYVVVGYMPNPKKSMKTMPGGQSAMITIWGIPSTKATSSNANNNNYVLSMPASSPQGLKDYNKDHKTAIMNDGSVYVGVVEYSQAVTPPNIMIPALQPFATIPSPKKSASQIMGGQSAKITLWGLKVDGDRVKIKSDDKERLGFFWPKSNVAQLNNGTTFVGVIKQLKPNYVSQSSNAMISGATGPIWTRYSQEELEAFSRLYKIKPSEKNTAQIGIAKLDGQKYIISGIKLTK